MLFTTVFYWSLRHAVQPRRDSSLPSVSETIYLELTPFSGGEEFLNWSGPAALGCSPERWHNPDGLRASPKNKRSHRSLGKPSWDFEMTCGWELELHHNIKSINNRRPADWALFGSITTTSITPLAVSDLIPRQRYVPVINHRRAREGRSCADFITDDAHYRRPNTTQSRVATDRVPVWPPRGQASGWGPQQRFSSGER